MLQMMVLGNTRSHLSHYMPDTYERKASAGNTRVWYNLTAQWTAWIASYLAQVESAPVLFTVIKTGSAFTTAVWEKGVVLHIVTFSVLTCCCLPIKTILPFLGHSN